MQFQEELNQWLSEAGIEDASRVVAVPVCATTPEQAIEQMRAIPYGTGEHIFVVEDRWRRDPEAMKTRVLSHLRVFQQVYARNCEVRRIDKPTAAAFLQKAHSYGDASCRYRYGLFLKRLTGEKSTIAAHQASLCTTGDLVAVAEFSAPRRWKKGGATVSSYEWVRYASIPGVRVVGGMGKLLKHFVEEQHPDDVMTYADLEWSSGEAYRQLGFVEESRREPVLFALSPVDWLRFPVRDDDASNPLMDEQMILYHCSPGSMKYRLMLNINI